jgi:hypothetical protein
MVQLLQQLELLAREREIQRRKAASYGRDLTVGTEPTLHYDAKEANPFQADPNCKHCHDKRVRNSRSSKTECRGVRKSGYDGSESNPSDLSDSSSEELPNK